MLVIVGGETDGRWLGGFDRQLRALMLSPLVGQKLGVLASSENATDLMALTELLESGKVTPVIDQTYELQDVAKALQRMTDGQAGGKIVVTM
jgi:NADPH:quinone reductase-like Zn-dependent oxidoreductase